MRMKWRLAWVLALVLVAAPAFALGLGQIQVHSQYGEPFLAEIPIVSDDPSELRQLQARLASPDTFSRIGLQPPEGLVLDLRFNVALDASGRPVIRVTTAEPVEQPLLTFLIEADWGQGRLVREYSALIGAPDAVAAPVQPPIQGPAAETGDRIVRPPAPPEAPPAAAAAPGPGEASGPAAVQQEHTAGARRTGGQTEAYGPVRAGQTLSQLVRELGDHGGMSANQMMLALLRANPDAFIGGNINLLREGAILRMPPPGEAAILSVAEADAEVRAQVARWREMSAPRAQAGDARYTADAGVDARGPEPSGTAAAEARLEIAPPATPEGGKAGMQSGITAGGEGGMLRQELQETRETLAARDAEVQELKARLAELEQIQDRQQQLIALKDSELAAVQQRLADTGQAEAGVAGPAAGGAPWLWLVLGMVVLVAAALAWTRTRGGRALPAGRSHAPAWHGPGREAGGRPEEGGALQPLPADPGSGLDPGPGPSPGDGVERADAQVSAEPLPAAGPGERLELARAYVELGDVETARSLLQELAGGGHGAESEEAARMLRGLA